MSSDLRESELKEIILRLVVRCGVKGECHACKCVIYWLRGRHGKYIPHTEDGLCHADCEKRGENEKEI